MSQLRIMAQTTRSSSGHSSLGSACKRKHLIRDIPAAISHKLCGMLDDLDAWQELSKLMSLPDHDMRIIRYKKSLNQSPSEEMLKIWGNKYGHDTDELLFVLHKAMQQHSRLQLGPAMRMLKDYVTYELRVIIPLASRPAISDLLAAQGEKDKSEKILNCSSLSDSLETRDDNYTTTTSSDSSANKPQQQQQQNTESTLLSERSVKEYASSNLEINYEELLAATKNWDESFILGKGGFGTVYKGNWKYTDVAIKVIHYRENIKVQIQQSLNELKYLNSFRHDNVLPLYGYSIRGEKPCLVYQFMRGGCLDKRLHTKNAAPLTLKQRLEICVGTACGINYIHTHTPGKPLIHGDIKPANVLLDQCLMPKIGDFGLAREGPGGVKIAVEVQQVFGTKCYLPPEFLNSKKLSTQVDTFSFGVTLMETFTGQRAYSKNRAVPLLTNHVAIFFSDRTRDIRQILDPSMSLQTAIELQTCFAIFHLALDCTAANPQQRPAMEEALKILRQLLADGSENRLQNQ